MSHPIGEDPVVVYKLKDLKTGKYYSSRRKWTSVGKVWSRVGHLKNSINAGTGVREKDLYIEEFELDRAWGGKLKDLP